MHRTCGRGDGDRFFQTLTFLIGAVLGLVVLALHERELSAEREVLLLPVQRGLLKINKFATSFVLRRKSIIGEHRFSRE